MSKSKREDLKKRLEKLESDLMKIPAEKKNNPGPASIMEKAIRKEIKDIIQQLSESK